WSRAETLLLIDIYKEHIAMFDNPKVSSKQCWSTLSKKMKEAGYQISDTKCATKFQSLKRSYKSVIDHNKQSGNNRQKWEYYEV
ncbi:Trihelix transcription factor GT-4, partial [Cyphomyrmex costatus]